MTWLARVTSVAMVVATPAFAHHGWGGNAEEVTSMTGTVVQGVSMAGPHATMKLKVYVDVWDITLAPPARAARSGLAEGLIPVGATVTVRGNKSMDAKRHEMKTIFVGYGDRQFHVYPERGIISSHSAIALFLHWLEASRLGHAMRESGVWTFGIVNLGHILGIAVLFGAILLLDLRMLGAWRALPLAALSRAAVTAAAAGFILAVLTGVPMLATKAGDYIGNPFLLIKFPVIALALVNVVILHRSQAWQAHRSRDLLPPEQNRLAIHAGLSLGLWLTVITAGRMIGYW